MSGIAGPDHTVRQYGYGYAGKNQRVGELTSITDKTAAGAVIASYGFAYDLNGNIKTETVQPEPTLDQLRTPAVSMTYTGDNRLATYNGKPVTYDDDGNMTNGPLGESGFATFAYDSRNRLVQAGTTKYTYNVENQRVKVEQSGKVTTYVTNPHAKLSQTLIKKDPGGKETFYIYGLGLVAQVQMDNSATHFYHYDLRGSTVALTDNTGAITDRFVYLPYGEITSHSGVIQTPFQFVGKFGIQRDGNDLYQVRARYYQENAKRFLNRDLLAGKIYIPKSINRYSYVGGNPISFIDVNGNEVAAAFGQEGRVFGGIASGREKSYLYIGTSDGNFVIDNYTEYAAGVSSPSFAYEAGGFVSIMFNEPEVGEFQTMNTELAIGMGLIKGSGGFSMQRQSNGEIQSQIKGATVLTHVNIAPSQGSRVGYP